MKSGFSLSTLIIPWSETKMKFTFSNPIDSNFFDQISDGVIYQFHRFFVSSDSG